MTKLKDKSILLGICLLIFFIFSEVQYSIIPILMVLIMSSSNSYFEGRISLMVSIILYAATSMYLPNLIYFLPLVCFDCFKESFWPICLILIIPLSANVHYFMSEAVLILLALCVIAYIVKSYSLDIESLKKKYFHLRDDMVESSRKLEQKNKILMDKQDYEVNLATLNERNRIAREIHDSVGHVMSSAILQVGALMATVGDGEIKTNLTDLKGTLTSGMNSIRNSVHDLHDNSVDLYIQLGKLVNDFTFCSLDFDYDMGEIQDTAIIYAIIAIVKEALANIMKHTNASHVSLIAREHPGLYQVIVYDNGTLKGTSYSKGMGLDNIRVRVESLNGIFNINHDSGFRLFVSIPKEVKK